VTLCCTGACVALATDVMGIAAVTAFLTSCCFTSSESAFMQPGKKTLKGFSLLYLLNISRDRKISVGKSFFLFNQTLINVADGSSMHRVSMMCVCTCTYIYRHI